MAIVISSDVPGSLAQAPPSLQRGSMAKASSLTARIKANRRKAAVPLAPVAVSKSLRVLFAGEALHVAVDFAAILDVQLAVANRARDPARGADQKILAHRERAFVMAGDFGPRDFGGALKGAILGDLDRMAILQLGLDLAVDDQAVARRNLAVERDALADDQLLELVLVAPRFPRQDDGRDRGWNAAVAAHRVAVGR